MKELDRVHFLRLLILAMLVNILGQAVHETGHHMVYQIMGHEPVWAFTKVVQMSEPPTNPADWVEITNPDGLSNWLKVSSMPTAKAEKAIMAAAGPLLGLFSAVLALFMSRRSANVASRQVWLVYALTISLVAVLCYLRSPIRTGGDEYDIAMQLGVAKAIIEIPLGLAYLTCLILSLRELSSWRIRLKWLGSILFGSIITGLLMTIVDPLVIAQVDAGNPWFQPVLGYSLPVFMVIVLTIIGIWGWFRWQDKHKT